MDALDSLGIHISIDFPIYNYTWDSVGLLSRFDPYFLLGNIFMLSASFLLYIGIWFLNIGYAPSSWLNPLQKIAKTIQNTSFEIRVFPFVAVVAGIYLVTDLAKRDFTRMYQRAVTFAVIVILLIVFKGIGTEKYLTLATDAINKLSYGATAWILSADQPVEYVTAPEDYPVAELRGKQILKEQSDINGSQSFEKLNGDIYNTLWSMMITRPWEIGQLGRTDLTVESVMTETFKTRFENELYTKIGNGNKLEGKKISLAMNQDEGNILRNSLFSSIDQIPENAVEINKIVDQFKRAVKDDGSSTDAIMSSSKGPKPQIDTTWITPGTKLSTLYLRFPAESSVRSDFTHIVSTNWSYAHPGFTPAGRLVLGVIDLICVLASCIYLFVMGAYLLILHFTFLFCVFVGMFVLAIALLPWNFNGPMLQWWSKLFAGSVVLKVGLSAYVGLTFLTLKVFSPDQGSVGWGNVILSLLLYPFIFVFMLWLLGRFQKFYRPFENLGGGLTQFATPDASSYGITRRVGNGQYRWYLPQNKDGKYNNSAVARPLNPERQIRRRSA